MTAEEESKRETEPDPGPGSARPVSRNRKKGWVIVGGLAILVAAALLTGGVGIGYLVAANRAAGPTGMDAAEPATTTWTCSMHPQFKLPKPGKCPICFMDLIPMAEGSGENDGPRQLRMSPAAMTLAEIQTVPVRRQFVTKPVRMVGRVDYDETRMANISAWVSGRLDRLFVDYTGVTVRKGDHLISLYSPDLIVAQRELLQTWQAYNRVSGEQDKRLVETTLRTTEEKLRLLGLLDEQIAEIKRSGTPSDRLTIYAPTGGIVIQKHANEGAYVETGTKIYTIADLTRVWVYLDAYESDVAWIRYGQEAEFTTESYPGEVFRGLVVFVDPVLDEKTRTVKIRVNVPNDDLRLKPGMFVRALVRSRLAAGGRVFAPSLAGKWISPMHPEVVKDGPGQCDVCGMDLVPAETLGLVGDGKAEPPLVIPASAPLVTGTRAVVYVRVPNQPQPTFEGREVLLGHRAGDYYIVKGGLEEGERVVMSGNFKIDADLQLKAKPSMMSMTGPAPLDVPDLFRRQLDAVYAPYLRLQAALADDRLDDARAEWVAMREGVERVPTETIDAGVGEAWQLIRQRLAAHLAFAPDGAKIEPIRAAFEGVAEAMLELADRFGHVSKAPLYEAYCPMAFDNRGAPWLQAGDTVDNPYFGHQMKRCGTIRREFLPQAGGTGKEDRP